MKRTWMIGLIALAILLAPSAVWAQKDKDCDITGSWISVSPPIPGFYTLPVWAQVSISLADPTGKRLTGVSSAVNPPASGDYWGGGGATVTFVRSGKGTYRFTWIMYAVRNNYPERGTILAIQTYSGTVECTGVDSLAFDGMVSFYDASQDQNGDGLPDPGQVPFLHAPWGWTAVRLPLLAP